MSTRPLKRNFVVNLLSPMTRIAVALVTVPLYLHHIGDARYGVMSIVWVLLGLFGFLDLGLSRAVTNALAKLRDAPQAQRARVLLTTFGLNLGIGLIGGAVLYVFGGLCSNISFLCLTHSVRRCHERFRGLLVFCRSRLFPPLERALWRAANAFCL